MTGIPNKRLPVTETTRVRLYFGPLKPQSAVMSLQPSLPFNHYSVSVR